jgi:tetratricopeptide (TPR) repeat protein
MTDLLPPCPPAPLSPSVLDLLASLVDKHLLRALDQDDDSRFGMLETMREYGLECLATAGEAATVRDRHVAWCLALAERAEPELTGPDQQRWYGRLEIELDNLRAALGWAIERRDAETAMRLAASLERFWTSRGLGSEGRRWLSQALAMDVAVPPAVRASALSIAAVVAYYQGDYGAASAIGEEALALCRAQGDQTGTAVALSALANVSQASGDFGRATVLAMEARELFRRLGDRGRAARTVNALGLIAWRQGDYERAEELHEEALALRREVRDRIGMAQSLSNLGLVATDRGDYARAAALQKESLVLEAALGNIHGLVDSFENVALNDVELRNDVHAAHLFGVAAALRARIGVPLVPSDRDHNERRIAQIRVRLGDAAFAAAWEAGRAMTLDEAIAYALESDPSPLAGDPWLAPDDRAIDAGAH